MAERKHKDESKTIQRPKENPELDRKAKADRERVANTKPKK